jgi:ribonuclease HI
MPSKRRENKRKYYGVRKGHKTGVFDSWSEALDAVAGYSKAEYKGFSDRNDAEIFVHGCATQTMSKTRRSFTVNLPRPLNACKTMIFTDGSSKDAVGGYAAVCVPMDSTSDVVISRGRVPLTPCTNQQAELYALLVALRMKRQEPFVIVTDSMYALHCARDWGFRFIKNGWKTAANKPVMNVDLISDIMNAQKGLQVEYKHVKAHSGNPYNELADKLAALGRNKM